MYLLLLIVRRTLRWVAVPTCGLFFWLASSDTAWTVGNTAPTITSQPANGIAGVGEDFVFSVGAVGTTPLTYQWLFNGANLAGQTNASLWLTNLTVAQSGTYAVSVANIAGSAVSSNAALAVQAVVPRRLATDRILQFGSQVGVPIILRANGRENALAFSLSYDTNAYSQPAFLTLYTNATVNTNLSQTGVAGVALTLPAGETFRAGYRLVGLMRFDLATGYSSLQGGLAFTTNPVPILAANPSALPLQISASVPPQFTRATINAQLNAQSGLFEQKLVLSNPSATVMTNLNMTALGLGVDSSSNAIKFFNVQSNLTTCPLNDCQVYVTCECTCDYYDPFWGFCYDYWYCSDTDCSTNITGTIVTIPYAQINNLLPGESRTVTMEFYVTDHLTVPLPKYALFLADPLLRAPPANATPLTITTNRFVNNAFLIEFPTQLGLHYYILYAGTMNDLATNALTVLPPVLGTGSGVQWLDNGPPKTVSPPVNGARFYRVLQSQ